MKERKITAVIISRGLETMLHYCLEHLSRDLARLAAEFGHHIVVVDNATHFPLQRAAFDFPALSLIRLDRNTSFSAACNRAAGSHPGDYYLLLNNDLLLAENTLASMMAVFSRDPQVGICGTRLLFPDNSIQHAGVVFGAGDKGPYHLHRGLPAHLVSTAGRYFQAVTGACMLIRHQVWEELNGLDEGYDFGLEDVDLCLRARQRGWKVYLTQKTGSLHFEAMTPGRAARDVSSRKRFMEKWRGRYTVDG